MKRLVCMLMLVAALGGCGRATRPNVVLIVLDTFRGDRLSCMGYARETTPRMDSIAREGALFTHAYATCFWTLPSHASILTGLHPVQVGATSETLQLPAEANTVGEVLQGAGYRTAGFVCNSWVSGERGFGQGFDEYVEMWRAENQDRSSGARSLEEATVARLEPWIASAAAHDKPFFLFVNLNSTHLPYKPAPEYLSPFLRAGYDMKRVEELARITSGWSHLVGETPLSETDYAILSDLYDGEVAWEDALVGRLVDALQRAGVLENTLVIITSDHGEHLGEKDKIDHMSTMYDPALHVPLIIRYPRAFAAGTKVDGLVSLVDIAPTIVDLCGAADAAQDLHAKTASLAAKDRAAEDFVIAGNERPMMGIQLLQSKYPGYDWQSIDYRMRCLRAPAHKLIWSENRSVELYDLKRDPAENDNLADAQPDLQRQMMSVLARTYEGMGGSKEHFMFKSTDKEALELLRSLGYIN